jgi:predicted TPR repeat methyltransferase
MSEINSALKLLEDGELELAEKKLKHILSASPNEIDALHAMGLISAKHEDFNSALKYFKNAIKINPKIAPFHNNIANTYKKLNQINSALLHYHETLKLQPNHANALNNIGSLLYRQGQYKQAIEYLKKSISINPKNINTHFNLSLCYIQEQMLLEAVAHLEETLKIQPEHLGAQHNLGIALCTLKNYPMAAELLNKVIKVEENNFDALYHAGIAFSAINQHNKAIECYIKALKLDAKHSNTHHNIAISYLNINDKSQAITHFKNCVKLSPNNETAKHMLSALTGQSSDKGAPIEYTRALFNQYALNYDEHTQNTLKLQAPSLLRQAFMPFAHKISPPFKILDVGCGTGLCAKYFIDISDIITGIDVSENMLLEAKKSNGYKKLYHIDAIEYLSKTTDKYDAIIASDTLVYFAKLEEYFLHSKQVLNIGGYICFSVEALLNSDDNYNLTPTGRYQHSKKYLQQTLNNLNIEILSFEQKVIRQQDDTDIQGFIVLGRIN